MAGEVGDPAANTPNTFNGRAPTGHQWDELRDATYCDQSLSCAPPIPNFHPAFS